MFLMFSLGIKMEEKCGLISPQRLGIWHNRYMNYFLVLVKFLVLNVLIFKIWIHIPVDRSRIESKEVAKTTHLQNVIEKKTMINLVSHALHHPRQHDLISKFKDSCILSRSQGML